MRKFYTALVMLLAATLTLANATNSADIGFSSYKKALESLTSNPAFSKREDQGWIVAENSAEKEVWTFTQAGHPAHPTVIQRIVVGNSGSVDLEMRVLCEGPKPACEQLVQEFVRINQSIVDSMNNGT